MEYITNTSNFIIKENTAITLGKFDGIHSGHQMLINKIIEKKPELKTLVFTFDMNPASAVAKIKESLITTNEERMHVVEGLGVDYLYECPFTDEIRNLEARDFVYKIVNELSVRYIAVGKDFRFGHNRLGDYRLLMDMAEECGYEIEIIEKEQYNNRDISSTYVREMISKGDMVTANILLGYPYAIEGIIEHGNQIGRSIGIPTANIIPLESKLLPPNGVYVSKVHLCDRVYKGITNIGVKPTVASDNRKGAETFIFDFDGDAYGQDLVIELYYFIRPEMKFDSIDKLLQQMNLDIEYAKSYKY